MCLMRKDNWCMRSYNNCTVQVLDQDTKSKQKDPLEDQTQTRDDLQGAQNETVEAEGPAREGDLNLEFENSDLASTEGSLDSVSTSDLPSYSTEGSSDLGSTSDSYSVSTEESTLEGTSTSSVKFEGFTTESVGLGNL
jgi:hypothetical protein